MQDSFGLYLNADYFFDPWWQQNKLKPQYYNEYIIIL